MHSRLRSIRAHEPFDVWVVYQPLTQRGVASQWISSHQDVYA